MASVTLVEVAPRDGFQSIKPFILTEAKIAIIQDLIASGIPRIEVGSFVNPRALPQMSDTAMLVSALKHNRAAELSVLVPNRKGAELALAAGVNNLVYVLSVSESHNRNNIGRSVEESVADLKTILQELNPSGRFRFDIATAFHCPFEGVTPLASLLDIIAEVAPLREDIEICLCDTTGRATPRQVASALYACHTRFGTERPWAYHAHDTYGFGLASIVAAYDAGVRIFDAAAGGLGGCPFAPGASGNVATEDVAYLFESMGISTGLDFGALLAAARKTAAIEGATCGGHIRGLAAKRGMDSNGVASDPLLDASPSTLCFEHASTCRGT